MFSLFGKNEFEKEISELEKINKKLGAELLSCMQRVDLNGQLQVMESIISLYDQRIECCKKYGKYDLVTKLESEKQNIKQLRG